MTIFGGLPSRRCILSNTDACASMVNQRKNHHQFKSWENIAGWWKIVQAKLGHHSMRSCCCCIRLRYRANVTFLLFCFASLRWSVANLIEMWNFCSLRDPIWLLWQKSDCLSDSDWLTLIDVCDQSWPWPSWTSSDHEVTQTHKNNKWLKLTIQEHFLGHRTGVCPHWRQCPGCSRMGVQRPLCKHRIYGNPLGGRGECSGQVDRSPLDLWNGQECQLVPVQVCFEFCFLTLLKPFRYVT